MIKAVIFDFFGVLCSDESWQTIKDDQRLDIGFRALALSMHTGEISWRQFVQKIAFETGKQPADIEKIYESENINLILAGYINKLHARYKTALLSNASLEFLGPMLRKIHLDQIFDEIIVSSETGLAKPDPKLFTYSLHKLGVKPHETVFIDDLAKHTIAAESLGIKTIHYKYFDQFQGEMENILASVTDN